MKIRPVSADGPGQIVDSISIPGCLSVTSVCFGGGPDLSDLYVTTSRLLGDDGPTAGSLFVVRGVGVGGCPSRQVDRQRIMST